MVLIGTWNLENFFPPGGPSGPTTQAAYQAKITSLAATIRTLGPDVLAVQEVGSSVSVKLCLSSGGFGGRRVGLGGLGK